MRNRLTQLEILETSHPGILTKAKQCLDKGKSAATTAALLNSHFGTTLTRSTLDHYRAKRWKMQREELQQQKNDFATKASLIKDRDLDHAAAALLFEEVRRLNPTHLLGIMRLKVQKDRLRLAKKALAKGFNPGATPAPQDPTPEEQAERQVRVVNRIKDIFGLSHIQRCMAWPQGQYLYVDEQGEGHAIIANLTTHELDPDALHSAYQLLCVPEGWHGQYEEPANKPAVVARLKDLFALQHLPWPEQTEATQEPHA